MVRRVFETRISVRVNRELALAVEAYAKNTGVSTSEAVRRLLIHGLKAALDGCGK